MPAVCCYMNQLLVAILDKRNRGVGGIAALNKDLVESRLQERFEFVKSGLCHMLDILRLLGVNSPLVFVLDEAFTWKELPRLMVLRIASRLTRAYRSKPRYIISREHHYSGAFVHHNVHRKTLFLCMLRCSYALVDRVISISQAQDRWMADLHLCPPSKRMLLIHSIDPHELLRLESPDFRRPIIFGFIGRLTFQKGIDRLLTCWAPLAQNTAVRLVIAGCGSWDEMVRKETETFPNVEVFGYSEPLTFYAKCHVILIPSRYEPYGQVCLEARAAGRLVVISDVDGLPEQLPAANSGFRCNFEDPTSLEATVRKILALQADNPAQLRTMAQLGRESAGSLFPAYLDALEALFLEACSLPLLKPD